MSGSHEWRDSHKAALIQLERLAQEDAELPELLQRGTVIIAGALGVEFCKILELLPGGETLLFRAGVGWREELIGKATVAASSGTHAGRTIASEGPIVIEDLAIETRFHEPSILHEHGVTSGVSLVIPGAEPFGVLAVHTSERRSFSAEEMQFLDSAAEILGRVVHRRRAREAISQSEARFRRIFEDSPIGMTLSDLEHRILGANGAICRLLGYSEEEFKGVPFGRITHVEDQSRSLGLAEKLVRGEIPHFQVEERKIARSGEAVLVRLTATLVRDETGHPLHTVEMMEDLTEQRRRERELRLARFTLERAPEAIGWSGPDGKIHDVNESMARLLGYSREELLAMSVSDIDPAMSKEIWPRVWRDLARRGFHAGEARFRRKDGVEVAVEISVNYLEHNGARYACTVARDVTERRMLTEKLAIRRQRYRELFENAAAMVSTMNLEGRFTAVNKAMESFTGYTRKELIGKEAGMLLAPDQAGIARKMTERKLREGGTTTYELEVLTKDGRWRPVQMTSSLIQEGGRPVGTLGIGIDISEQRRAQEALRRSEEHFRALIENAQDVITVLDADGTIRYVSPSIEKMLGYTAEERIGKSTFDLIHPDDLAIVRETLAAGRETPDAVAALEFRVRHKDGTWRYIEAIARNLLENAAVSGVVVNSRDATARKAAENALRESEDRFAFALGVSRIGHWDLNLEDHSAYRSLEHDRIFGYSELRPEWSYETFLEKVLPEDRGMVDEKFRAAVAAKSNWDFECRIVRADGDVRWIWACGQHRVDETGVARRMVGVVQDITERKRAEQALRQSQAELRELAARLISDDEEEHQSLARELHDDFGQRLAALGFDLATLEAECPAQGPERLKRKLNAAQAAVAGLSDDLRRLAHQLHPSAIELLGLPAALRGLCEDASKHRRFTVRFQARKIPDSLPPSVAVCLYRVAQECLRNIAKHAEGDRVSVTLAGVGRSLRLSIRDNGIGFDSSAPRSRGGLGLISMRERVRLAGGSLTIQSRPGEGALVCAEVPVSDGPEAGG